MQKEGDELTHGKGGRIKEVEEYVYDEFKIIGEGYEAGKLRAQEDIFQKTSAILSDKVSTILWC